jgi:hypothetical protein
MIAKSFNKYYLSITETIVKSTLNSHILNISNKAKEYLIHIFKNTFPPINYSQVTTSEIDNIIDKLKMANSKGYEEIPIKVIQIVNMLLSHP